MDTRLCSIVPQPSAPSDAWAGTLLERAAELAAVATATDDVLGGTGRVLVLSGPAGIGKTALLRAAQAQAGKRGLRVLHARATALERDAGFSVARLLLERAATGSRHAFDGQARLAAGVLGADLGERMPPPPTAGSQALADAIHGLYWVTANLSARRPLGLVVDDAHWADPPSLRVLAYLATRIADLPVLLVVAMRDRGEGSAAAGLAASSGAIVLRPRPLSPGATARLVRREIPDASAAACRSCYTATGGNPFFVGELAATMRTTGAGEVRGLLPRTVLDAVVARIAALPAPARALAQAVAVLGDGTPVRHAAAIAGLDADAALGAADALAAAGIVEDRWPLSFVHPIVREAVHAELPAGRRAVAHGRAARMLADEGAPLEQVAAQLLGTEPSGDGWTFEHLVDAGRREFARGGLEAAVAAFRRALLEPPTPEQRASVLLELGTAETMALQVESAIEHLSAALEVASDPDLRLNAALRLGAILGGQSRSPEAVALLEQALRDAPGADPALAGEAEGQIVNIARFHPATRERVAERSALLRSRVDAGAAAGAAELTAVAADMVMAGESAPRVAELANRALAAAPDGSVVSIDYVLPQATRSLIIADHFDAAQALLERAIVAAVARGSDYERVPVLAMRGELLLRRGMLVAAEADMRRCLALADPAWSIGVQAITALLAETLLERGAIVESRRLVARADPDAETYPAIMALYARGRVRAADGDAAAAAEDFLRCGPLLHRAGERNPAIIDWRSRAAMALATLGDGDRAAELADEELALARRFEAPRAIGLALRARAAVGGDALADLREAVSVLAGSPALLARGHVLAELGMALLAAGQAVDAREPLLDAAESAHRCGAAVLAERVLEALHRTGARPRRLVRSGPEALTPAERRVAQLAASGMANREIAAQLFVAPQTVEFHLSATYRKLRVAGRRELAAALGGP